MENIIPRWEWRTFGESFGEAEHRLPELETGMVQESDELYLPPPLPNENAKSRDLQMDIKPLEQVNPDGLEQWNPVMKGAFPLPAAVVKSVFIAVGVPPPPLTRPEYTLQQFISELV